MDCTMKWTKKIKYNAMYRQIKAMPGLSVKSIIIISTFSNDCQKYLEDCNNCYAWRLAKKILHQSSNTLDVRFFLRFKQVQVIAQLTLKCWVITQQNIDFKTCCWIPVNPACVPAVFPPNPPWFILPGVWPWNPCIPGVLPCRIDSDMSDISGS